MMGFGQRHSTVGAIIGLNLPTSGQKSSIFCDLHTKVACKKYDFMCYDSNVEN